MKDQRDYSVFPGVSCTVQFTCREISERLEGLKED